MNVFFLVPSIDEQHVYAKIKELTALRVPYLIVSGKRINKPHVVYREPRGKYDAINFGSKFIPKNVDVVVLNDVDTKIQNFESALKTLYSENAALLFGRVVVEKGPQQSFYPLLDFIRRRVLVSASGELMLIRKDAFDAVIPIKRCKAEDSYILFKVLELKGKAVFCEVCYVETRRTVSAEKEEEYKRKTVCGIYQALAVTKPHALIRLFYFLLPLLAPLLLVSGRKGYFWTRGIFLGLADYLRGDQSGTWLSTYMN